MDSKEPKHIKESIEKYRKKDLDKPLPSSVDAERACLGSVLLTPTLVNELFSYIEPTDFYLPLHQHIAAHMYRLMQNGKPIDAIAIAEPLKLIGVIESISDVLNLMNGIPHVTTLKTWADTVKKKAIARKAIKMCDEIQVALLAEDEEPDAIVSNAVTSFIAMQHVDTNANVSLAEVSSSVRDTFNEWSQGNTSGSSIKSGIPELDGHLRMQGFALGDLILIGARPSMGKTGILIQCAVHGALMGYPVLFLSLEMQKENIVMRMLPSRTGIANKAINPYTLQHLPNEREKLMKALDVFEQKQYPIYFDRSRALPQIIARVEYFVQRYGVKMVVFDYLTLIDAGIKNDNVNQTYAVGKIVTEMKDLAFRNKIVCLGAAQFSRDIEKLFRRPRMDDFRDSGVIEQAADVILFPWDANGRANKQNPELTKDKIWLDLYCEKQRDGERTWTVKLEYDKNLQIFQSEEMCGRTAPTVRSTLDAVVDANAPITIKSELDYHDWHDRD